MRNLKWRISLLVLLSVQYFYVQGVDYYTEDKIDNARELISEMYELLSTRAGNEQFLEGLHTINKLSQGISVGRRKKQNCKIPKKSGLCMMKFKTKTILLYDN